MQKQKGAVPLSVPVGYEGEGKKRWGGGGGFMSADEPLPKPMSRARSQKIQDPRFGLFYFEDGL